MGITLFSMGMTRQSLWVISVSLSVVFLHLAYSERFISKFVGMFLSLITYHQDNDTPG